jgi:hypothetical protein
MIVKNLVVLNNPNGNTVLMVDLPNKTDARAFNGLIGVDLLELSLTEYKPKRSLTANATLWLLLQRLAVKLGTSKDELYLEFLKRYGTFTHVIVKPKAVDAIKREWKAVVDLGEVTVNGQVGIQLQLYFGSSTFNSKEFSHLLQGVIDECEEQGLETITSKEFDRLIKSIDKE